MRHALRLALVLGSLLAFAAPAYPQAALAPTFGSRDDCLSGPKDRIQSALNQGDKAHAEGSAMRAIEDYVAYVCYLSWDPIRAQLLTEAELNRMDKQPGASSNSSGSTSLVSKGGAPWLLGFALEHGGLTQSTNGNTITFRGSVVNSISALLRSTYLDSYKISQEDPVVRYLSKLSFGISFDTRGNQATGTQGFTPTTKNFSGLSAKYELINHRDPRDKSHWNVWRGLADGMGAGLADSILDLRKTLEASPSFAAWKTAQQEEIHALVTKGQRASADDINKVVHDAADSFEKEFAALPQIKNAVSSASKSLTAFLQRKSDILREVRKTFVITGEYNLTRQLTTNDKNITSTQPNQKVPDLSNINLVIEKGFVHAGAPDFTFNVGATWFNSPNTANPEQSRVRDFRASLEADWQLTKLTKLDKPTLSFSGQYLNLFEEPLGQKVTLNGVTIDRRGPMEVFQAKLSIPVAASGVKIPISFTYASRTELVKEKDTRGNIGITFDLDPLFSRLK